MKKNQITVLISGLLLIGLTLSCNSFGNKSGRDNKVIVIANSNSDFDAPKSSAAECPKATLSINEAKDKALAKYEGCLVTVKGKIWEVDGNNAIALIDTTDRTGYTNKIHIGGDFSSDNYYEIGRKISEIKLDGQYEKLPVATFTGTVDADGWLDDSVLTDVRK